MDYTQEDDVFLPNNVVIPDFYVLEYPTSITIDDKFILEK